MGILDEINNMKNQGMDDNQIIDQLQERGVTPKSINEAFNQMRIKKAVSAESSGEEGMEPSIMKNSQPASLYTPKTQEIDHESSDFYNPQQMQSLPQPPQFNEEVEAPRYGGSEEYSPQEGYGEQGTGAYDTDTLIEIAEQVFSEKIKKEQKRIDSLNEFATLAETRMSNDHERIKKVEDIIDKLQAAILEKVGSYGRNLESIKNEMGMMQESFGKMVPSLQERHERHEYRERNEEHKEHAEEEHQKKSSKKK